MASEGTAVVWTRSCWEGWEGHGGQQPGRAGSWVLRHLGVSRAGRSRRQVGAVSGPLTLQDLTRIPRPALPPEPRGISEGFPQRVCVLEGDVQPCEDNIPPTCELQDHRRGLSLFILLKDLQDPSVTPCPVHWEFVWK